MIKKKKVYTRNGIDLSIQRNCVHVRSPEGGFCVGRTLERIVQRPGELILFRCQLTRHLAARWTAIAILIGGEGGKEKRDVDGHFDGASFVARKLEEWYKEGYIIVFHRFVFRVFRAARYLRCLRVWIVESFTMLQIIRNKIWYVLHTWQPPGVYLLISRDWWFGWRDVV